MALDLTDAHPAGVEADDLLVQPRQSGLALGDQLRLKAPSPIARRLDLDRSELGLHRLGRLAVAMVPGATRGRLPRRVAQVLAQLSVQRGLDHAAGELGEQATRPSDLLRLQALQRPRQDIVGEQARKVRRRRDVKVNGGLGLLRGHVKGLVSGPPAVAIIAPPLPSDRPSPSAQSARHPSRAHQPAR